MLHWLPMDKPQKTLLIILDGMGEGKAYPGNAVTLAKTPNLTYLKKNYPWTLLEASGEAVGIPAGSQGGSEVGHFTIGAGRIVFQSLEEINRSIKDNSFFSKKPLIEACGRVIKNQKRGKKSALHLLGMISDQGVHSHIDHLFALLELAKKRKCFPVYIHAILDGRDVPEKSAEIFLKRISEKIQGGPAKIATIIGRYYSMDRDTNWNRTETAYNLYTLGTGKHENNPFSAIKNAYKTKVESDYYIKPIILDKNGVIGNDDSVIFWNFRTDRSRQLTWAFTGEKPPKETGLKKIGFKPKKIVRPYFVCMGPYSNKAPVVFPLHAVRNNLGETVSKAGLKQLRIAETEKYAHVTFFFNSQKEKPFKGETHVLIHSPKCPSYADKPEMSAYKITHRLIQEIKTDKYHLIVCNFANCDLVGHSGELKPAIKAVETVDDCVGQILKPAAEHGYKTIICSDHGNVEYMLYKNGEQCPSHTINPVPCVFVGIEISTKARSSLKSKKGGLKDIAPTILKIMGIKKPVEMTGKSIV